MSFAELKEQVAALSPDDRRELAALITHLNRKDSPEYLEEMDRRLDSISAKRIVRDDFQKVHRSLNDKGK